MAWTPARERLAWAAGFFDGEGSTYADPRPRMQVVQNDRAVLDTFHAAIGGIGKVGGGKKIYGRAKRPMFTLRITGWRDVQAVVAMLWPWLSDVKKRQAVKVLLSNAFAMALDSRWGGNRNTRNPLCGRPHLSGGVAACRTCQRICEQRYEERQNGAVTS